MKPNTNTTPIPQLRVCEVCKQTGKFGAKWLFFVGDAKEPKRVHKPCGEMLQGSAPEGVRTNLVPSRELREEWRTKRLTQNFWGEAFANAKPLKVVSAKESKPVLATVTTPSPMTVVPAAPVTQVA